MSKTYRDQGRLLDDCILPRGIGLGGIDNRRSNAIVYILARLPESPYQSMVEQIDSFDWFLPHPQGLGMVQPVGKWIRRMLYLSPKLEDAAEDILTAVVAHEVAHIALRHKTTGCKSDEYEQQEKQAFDALCEWGFKKEAKKHRAFSKRRDTMLAKAEQRARRLLRSHR